MLIRFLLLLIGLNFIIPIQPAFSGPTSESPCATIPQPLPQAPGLAKFAKMVRTKLTLNKIEEVMSKCKKIGGHTYSQETPIFLATLFTRREEFSDIRDEKERNEKITSATTCVEDGFCRGSKEEVLLCINAKASLLIESFSVAQKTNVLHDYCINAFGGDPCFNGRMIALENWAAKHIFKIDIEAMDNDLASADMRIKYNRLITTLEAPGQGGNKFEFTEKTTVGELKAAIINILGNDEYNNKYKKEIEALSFVEFLADLKSILLI